MLDLEKVIVVTGFVEVGPCGSSRTRWEMEAHGKFTIEGCIEMAWMIGYIKHFDGRLKDGALYIGWVDSKTGEPVDDKDIRGHYEKDILTHAGVRLIEPELFRDYDPKKKAFNQEIELLHDLEPFEVAEVEEEKFKYEHGDKCDIWADEGGQWFVKFKKGSRILVPKAFKFNRLIGSQIPTGWSVGRYGIPADIIAQTDRMSLWALASAAEALNMSGITDPYELYQHMHPSEVGSSIGSGMGSMESLSQMFKDRRDEKEVQNDILQETFINTTAGWINLLLLSSSGPIKIPVGACATALQSMEIACDTLLSGKAKVMLAGGFDDLSEEGSYEFANMKATSNSETEFAVGLTRPDDLYPHLVQLAFRHTQISQWLANEQHQLQEEIEYHNTRGETVDEEYFACRVADIEQEVARQEKDALATYGMLQGTDPRMRPSIGLLPSGVSLPTTLEYSPSTEQVLAPMLVFLIIFGGSAAWQLAGLFQSVESGIIPGNRNADNVDANFKKYTYLVFPSKMIHTDGIRTGVMSFFGFGQVVSTCLIINARDLLGTCLIVNARDLLGALEPDEQDDDQ
ncbi:hypothetical protein A0H81_14665 [Grifola frondosa]|uniref:beta-ketoacyl-[acyl-carrier-protein] synthase I n=1 Tax=Grifola frondosa TaxID=5627 RepID=A0A1C7LMX7_GRIFR|nr:hypothetical protein A0H81_14665 [Grifola frondosa]